MSKYLLVGLLFAFLLLTGSAHATNTTNETNDCGVLFDKYDTCMIEKTELLVNYTDCKKDLEFSNEIKTSVNDLYRGVLNDLDECEIDVKDLKLVLSETKDNLTKCKTDYSSLQGNLVTEQTRYRDCQESAEKNPTKIGVAFIGGVAVAWFFMKGKVYLTDVEREHGKRAPYVRKV